MSRKDREMQQYRNDGMAYKDLQEILKEEANIDTKIRNADQLDGAAGEVET